MALLAGTALVGLLASGEQVLDAILVAAIALPLLARRRAPLLVLAVVIALGYAGYASGPSMGGSLQAWIALNVALYSVAAHFERRRAILGGAIVAAFVLAFEIPRLVEGGRVEDVAGEWLFVGGVWLLGRWVRQRRHRTEDLERDAADLKADREALAREALADDRARIAREMHDSVAHSVSLIVLHAGAADEVLAGSPERARQSLVTIQDTGREAIVELGRMLGLLRGPVVGTSLSPQPGVDRLEALLERVRAAGLPVELTVEGQPRRLPPERRPLGVPDRPGRADQRPQARRPGARQRAAAVRRPSAGGDFRPRDETPPALPPRARRRILPAGERKLTLTAVFTPPPARWSPWGMPPQQAG